MSKMTSVNLVMSVVLVIYALLLVQQHYLLLFAPVLLLQVWYVPFELLAVVGLLLWGFYMFAFWFVTILNGGFDE